MAGFHPKGGPLINFHATTCEPDCVVFHGIGCPKAGGNHVVSSCVNKKVYDPGHLREPHSDVKEKKHTDERGVVNPPGTKNNIHTILKLLLTSFLTMNKSPT